MLNNYVFRKISSNKKDKYMYTKRITAFKFKLFNKDN